MAMDCLLHLATLILLISSINGRAIDDLDNSIPLGEEHQPTDGRDWVQISESPAPKLIQPIGSTIELECEVTGSPIPTVHWVRGSKLEPNMNDFVSNLISESSPNSLVRVRSRLLVDVDGPAEKTYMCVGQSGPKTAYATTTVYGSSSNIINQHNISDILALNRNSGPKKPRIVLYYSVIFEEIGTNVVLPCKASGRPHPNIYWLDTNDNVITGKDPRIRVLPSGELLISYLRWSDMGTFTCIAQNALAKDAAATFVYPVLNE